MIKTSFFRKTQSLLITITILSSFVQAEEYSLSGEQKEAFHQELNSFTHLGIGSVSMDGNPQASLVVGLGSWLDGANYGYGLNIHFMPSNLDRDGSKQKIDYNAISAYGGYVFLTQGWVELNIYHAIGVGMLKVITADGSKNGTSQYYEGFGFGDIGLGFDFPVSNSFEIKFNADWRQGLAIGGSPTLSSSELSGPSVQLGFRWYPNAVSEVK